MKLIDVLRKLLLPKREVGTIARATNVGPGEPDLFKKLLEKNKNCFTIKESATVKNKKQKIIVSYGFFDVHLLNATEMQIWDDILKDPDFEVYIYAGPTTQLKNYKPVTNLDEFLVLKSKVVPATEKEIQEWLALQKESQDGMTIFDFANYHALLDNLRTNAETYCIHVAEATDANGKETLDLSMYPNLTSPALDKHIKKSVGASKIKEVVINAVTPAELAYIFDNFKNLAAITIKGANTDWIKALQYFPKINVKLEDLIVSEGSDEKYSQDVKFPESNIIGLEINFSKNVKDIDNFNISNLTSLESIKIKSKYNPELRIFSLEICNNTNDKYTVFNAKEYILYEYQFKNSYYNIHIHTINKTNKKSTSNFFVYNYFHQQQDIDIDLTKIECEIIGAVKNTEIDCGKLTNIQTLVLIKSSMLKNIKNISPTVQHLKISEINHNKNLIPNGLENTNIKTLDISSSSRDINEITTLPPKLETATLNGIINWKVKSANTLKQLTINGYYENENVNLYISDRLITELSNCDLPNLNKLTLENCQGDVLDLSQFTNLTHLKMVNCQYKKIILSPAIKYFHADQIAFEAFDFNRANIEYLYCDNTSLTLPENLLTSLTVLKAPKIEELYVRLPGVIKMDLLLHHLHELKNVETLDISTAENRKYEKTPDPNEERKINLPPSVKHLNIDKFHGKYFNIDSIQKVCINIGYEDYNIDKINPIKVINIAEINSACFNPLEIPPGVKVISIKWSLLDVNKDDFDALTQVLTTLPKSIESISVVINAGTIKTYHMVKLNLNFPELKAFSIHFVNQKINSLEINNNSPQLHTIHLSQFAKVDISNAGTIANISMDQVPIQFEREGNTITWQAVETKKLSKQEESDEDEDEDQNQNQNQNQSRPTLADNPELTLKLQKYLEQRNKIYEKRKDVSEEDLLIDAKNKKNKTSIMNITSDENITPDGDTTHAKNNEYEAAGNYKFTFLNADDLTRAEYRVNVVDGIQYGTNGIIFKNDPKIGAKEIKFKRNELKVSDLEAAVNNKNQSSVYIEAELQKGVLYPLPTRFGIQNPNPDAHGLKFRGAEVKLHWHERKRQFFMELVSSSTTNKIEVLYNLEKKPDPQLMKQLPVFQDLSLKKRARPSNFNDLIDKLKKSRLAFLFDKSSLDVKILKLIDYCEKFNDKDIGNISNHTDRLVRQAIEQAGESCRHRAQVFDFLAQEILSVPTNLINNEEHQYVEIPYGASDKPLNDAVFTPVNLGGSVRIDKTAEEVRKSKIDEIKEKQLFIGNLYALENLKQHKETLKNEEKIAEKAKANDPAYQFYLQKFNEHIQSQQVDSIHSIIQANKKKVVIELAPHQTAFTVNHAFINELKTKKYHLQDDYLYINNPRDFDLYLKPNKIENGGCLEIEGPLKKLITNGGTLVINLSYFTPKELVAFQSLFETPPMLYGQKVSDKLTVIGLMNKEADACTAFLSRTQKYYLHPDYVKQHADKEIKMAECDDINLHQRTNWRRYLLGEITFKGRHLALSNGKLIDAIHNKKSLIIYNPPQDNDFKELIERIQSDRKYYYNGAWINVPDDFSIILKDKPYNENISVDVDDGKDKDRSGYVYLNINNLHECYETLVVNNQEKSAKLEPGGFFKDSKPGTVFYVTDSIPEGDWRALMEENKKYADKHFKFVLAPNAAIVGIQHNSIILPTKTHEYKAKDEKIKFDSRVFFSNDKDYLAQAIAENIPDSIIHVSPDTTYTDLILKIHLDLVKKGDQSFLECGQIEQGVLQALRTNKRVILNGEISPLLYQQLLPLLSTPPFLYINGKRSEVEGKLYCVMPLEAKARLSPLDSQTVNYSFEYYQSLFSDTDQADILKIKKLYDYIAKIPHTAEMPAQPHLTHRRLLNSLNALKRQRQLFGEKKQLIHKHNPLKGLLHYSYRKQGKDYAFLNVVAKHLFDEVSVKVTNEQSLSRINHKLQLFLEKNPVNKPEDLLPNLWQILNCFTGNELRFLLGTDLNKVITQQSGYPALTDDSLANIFSAVKIQLEFTEKSLQSAPLPTKDQTKKRKEQLNTLLKDPNTNIIFALGDPGVGKTYLMQQFKDNPAVDFHNGENDIIKWLEAKDDGDKDIILFLDEANRDPKKWAFLMGMSENKKEIYYEGKLYQLTPLSTTPGSKPSRKKIITTGNYDKREHHKLFQEHAETLYFTKPTDDFISNNVIYPALDEFITLQAKKQLEENTNILNKIKNSTEYQNELAKLKTHCLKTIGAFINKKVLWVYHHIHDYNAFCNPSIRDIDSLLQRFLALWEKNPEAAVNDHLYHACMGEFAGGIADKDKRFEFIKKLQPIMGYSPDDQLTKSPPKTIPVGKIHLPIDKKYLLDAFNQDLAIRNKAVSCDRYLPYRHPLLEGSSGMGKSTLAREFLEANEFSQDHNDPQKRFYILTAYSSNIYDKIIKAFYEGSVVILDEINLDENINILLNHLLTGKDEHGKMPDQTRYKPGFMVFASQNQTFHKGRAGMPDDFRNRMHEIYFDDFTTANLEVIAEKNDVQQPKSFVMAFEDIKKANPGNPAINNRTCFEAMHNPLFKYKAGAQKVI